MSSPLSNDLLGRLSGWATAEFGLRFPPDRWSELARGVASAALELGIPDLEGWVEKLVSGQRANEYLPAVADHLTISETYFFRQPEAFDALEKRILPERLARRHEQRRPLRVWSAGCASGEEPYSVALLLQQRFPGWAPAGTGIIGTDINSRVLARAGRGLYSEWSFRDTPEWVRQNYFTRAGAGRFELAPVIRRRVRFVRLNLASVLYPAEFGEAADFDVILCRNVLMYFSAEWQDRIIRRLVLALAPEGWLLTGPCDVTPAQSAELSLEPAGPGAYRKLAGRAAGPELRSVLVPPLPPPPPAAAAPPPEPSVAPVALRVERPVPAVVTAAASEGDIASARAQSHANRGELDAALAACDEAIALDKTNADYHHLRACILQEQNRLTEAAEAYRRVLFLEPRSIMAQFSLGCVAEREGRRGEARHHFALVLRTLSRGDHGDPVPGSDGLTVGRLRAVIENTLADDSA